MTLGEGEPLFWSNVISYVILGVGAVVILAYFSLTDPGEEDE